MYAGLAFQPSQYSGLSDYGAPPKGGYPCIKKGADDKLSGGAVSAVEIALGFSPPRGVFDSGLDNAIRQFQLDNGLDVDGIVGPITGKKLGLDFQSCTSAIQTTAAPVDVGGGEPGVFEKINIFRLTNPGIFYGSVLLGGVALFAGGAIFLNERKRR